MNVICRLLLAGPVVAFAVSPAALADGARPTARAAGAATVRLANTGLGQILVNRSGSTLFMFTRDGHNVDRCLKISGCPPFGPH